MKQAKEALAWQILMKEELGRAWLEPELFRFRGASSMLGDIERQLEHHLTGATPPLTGTPRHRRAGRNMSISRS